MLTKMITINNSAIVKPDCFFKWMIAVVILTHRLRLGESVQRQSGVTLVELIVVLSLIAILATIAVPRFLNLSTNANQEATNGIASSLTTASAANFAQRSANSSVGSAISNCTQIDPLLSGGLPAGYSIV